MSQVKRSIERATLLATATLALGLAIAGPAAAAPEDYDFESVGASLSTTQAGAHPDVTVSFELTTDPASVEGNGLFEPYGRTRDVTIGLPPGMVGNPTPVPTCAMEEFVNYNCPVESQVGILELDLYGIFTDLQEPLFLLRAPSEGAPARFGFIAYIYPMVFDAGVRSESDFGLDSKLRSAFAQAMLVSSKTTIWGVPADPAHDDERFSPQEAIICEGGPCGVPIKSGLPPVPFMSNPTSCSGPQQVDFEARSYGLPDRPVFDTAALPAITGCDAVPFDPAMSVAPTSRQADSPTGLEVAVDVPQSGLQTEDGLVSAHVRKIVTRLPEGMAVNPSAADGLASCSPAEVGLISTAPIRFATDSPGCPESSKIAEATITTPILAEPMHGGLYLAKQQDNPFNSLLAGYLVVRGSGVTIKLAGRFEVDPQTGRITTTFDNNPQQPFSRLELSFKGGTRGVLVTPPSCGTYAIDSEIVPWSAADPSNPSPEEVATETSSFTVDAGPDGGPCPAGGAARPFGPGLTAGLVNPVAGESSPFTLRVTRPDGHQELDTIEVRMPEGLLASLAGVGICAEASAVAGTCPASSRVGSVTVGTGAGLFPYYVQGGEAFLAGPYRGAPVSLVIVVPAKAGPFDLGTVVVRTATHLDPRTARITAIADPLPQILEGIPVRARDVRVAIDRSGFMRAPTDCEPFTIGSTLRGAGGAQASPSDRFQVGECAALGFRPRLELRLLGGTQRADYQGLRATLRARPGDANIGRAAVTMPRSVLLAQEHIRTVCTRVQFAADACPKGSIYGKATAKTPLLDQPLTGDVYLRSSDNQLPDLVADLRGPAHQPVRVELVGEVDSVKRALRTTFDVPDAPVTQFTLRLFGGRKGLIVNSQDLCRKRAHRATVKLDAQSGRRHDFRPAVRNGCAEARPPAR